MKHKLSLMFLVMLFFVKAEESSFIDLTKNNNILAEIITTIGLWDKNVNSPIHRLHQYVLDGHTIADKDVVLDALAYAEEIVEQQTNEKSSEQLVMINNLLDVIANHIECGDFAMRSFCAVSESRGPRGHRGH